MLTMVIHLAVADSVPLFLPDPETAPASTFALAQVLPKRARGKFPRDLLYVYCKYGRIAGEPIVVVVLIEREGEMRTILRSPCLYACSCTKGTLLRVDEGERLTRPTSSIFTGGCLSDYEAAPEFITKLKNGQGLLVHGVNGSGQAWIQVRRSRRGIPAASAAIAAAKAVHF
jgi:hypothetical protein